MAYDPASRAILMLKAETTGSRIFELKRLKNAMEIYPSTREEINHFGKNQNDPLLYNVCIILFSKSVLMVFNDPHEIFKHHPYDSHQSV